MKMTKTEIKNAANNVLIMGLAETFATIIRKEGVRCKADSKLLNDIANELFKRGFLTAKDIEKLQN
jgi:hypothetical protein